MCNNDHMSEQTQATQAQATQTNGMAIASLSLGAVATMLALTLMFLAPIPALLAIIFGFIGNSRAKQRNGAGHTASLWGVLLGFMPLIIAILLMSISAASTLH